MADRKPIPVIDLFAGPGGLGEGFSSLKNLDGTPKISLRVSIEKDFHAHQTLSLRALFRHFAKGKAPDCYYDYLKDQISRNELFSHPEAKEAGAAALDEARLAELAQRYQRKVSLIGQSLGGIYARELARRSPALVRQVITLGSQGCCREAKLQRPLSGGDLEKGSVMSRPAAVARQSQRAS